MSNDVNPSQDKDLMIDSIIEETRYLSEKEEMEKEAEKFNKTKRVHANVSKEEIYSNKSKEVRYTNQSPLDIADDDEQAQAPQEPEEATEEKGAEEPEKVVTLSPEYEEGTKISDEIVEDVDNFNVNPVKIKDIDTIDIDLDLDDEEDAPKEMVESKPFESAENDAGKEAEAPSEFERIFGKPKPVTAVQTVVSKVPVYQHESRVEKVHVRAGKFSAVVENEYKKYIASPNPVISQMVKPEEEASSQVPEEEEKTPKKVAGSVISKVAAFFSSDGEDDDEFREKTVQIEDYRSRQDASSVMQEINANIRKMFINTAFMSVITLVLLVLAIVTKVAGSTLNQVASVIFGLGSALLLIIGCWICRVTVFNGLSALKRFKGNSDTGCAIAAVTGVVQSIISVFISSSFSSGEQHLYALIVAFALLVNNMGKLFMVLRVKDNFKFVSQKSAVYAGKIYVNEDIAKKLMSGTVGKPIVAYQHESDFLTNYLKISYSPDPSEDMSGKIAPVAILCSLFVAVLYAIISGGDVLGAFSALAVMAVVSCPVANLLSVNLPMRKFCKDTLQKNAMVAGYPSVRQFCDTKAVMCEAADLYPADSITLNGVKAFNNYKIEDNFLAAAALLREAKSPMASVFDNVVDSHGGAVPKVESVMYEDKLGLVGWVGGQRYLIGTAALLEKFGITPPAVSGEEKYMKEGRLTTYLAKGGQAVAMFVTTYSSTLRIAQEIQRAEANGISILVRTTDPGITSEKIAEDFGIFFRSVKVLSTGLGNVCREVSSQKEDSSRAYLATHGSFLSFIRAISGCVRMKSNISLAVVIQLIGIIMGVLITAAIVLWAGVSSLGTIEIMLFVLFWASAAIIAPLIQKP